MDQKMENPSPGEAGRGPFPGHGHRRPRLYRDLNLHGIVERHQRGPFSGLKISPPEAG